MEPESIELGSAHVKAIDAVLKVNKEFSEELDDRLSENGSGVEVELENRHQKMLVGILEGYKGIYVEELPENEDYIADFDVINEILDKIESE